jgi:hypothetical protein
MEDAGNDGAETLLPPGLRHMAEPKESSTTA